MHPENEQPPRMKLGVKDKNIVAMCWLAEMILKSLCAVNQHAPAAKQDMYDYISGQFVEAYEKARALNDAFNEQIRKTFSEEFEAVLADLTIAVIALYESTTPEVMLKILRAAGMSETMSAEIYAKGLDTLK